MGVDFGIPKDRGTQMSKDLPEVCGRTLEMPLGEFERRARVLIANEQDKINQDNFLISVLGDAVRLAREYGDSIQKLPPWPGQKGMAVVNTIDVVAGDQCKASTEKKG